MGRHRHEQAGAKDGQWTPKKHQRVASPTIPAPRPARSVLFGLPPVGNRYPGAVRVALALAIPAAIATLLGFGSASLLVGLGAFASIYGEGRPYRSRWKAVGIAATALTILSFVGASVG